MGVLNVTPDSFSDGGRYIHVDAAYAHVVAMVEAGAAVIDIGGESTRPGAAAVSTEEQLARVIPVIERLASEIPVVISIDTSDPEVMRAAVAAGAGMINDIRALRVPGALSTAAALDVPVVLMHAQGEPETMQCQPQYRDVVAEVIAFLRERIAAALAAGLAIERLWVDPGFGFGKTLAHNLRLLKALEQLAVLECPIVVGLSRKSMLGAVTGAKVNARLPAGLAAAVLAVERGAMLVRTHDVAPTVQALALVAAMRQSV